MTHNEIIAASGLAIAVILFAAGLFSGHWWWPSRERLDDEWNDGFGAGRDEGYRAGYSIGADDATRGLAYVYDRDGQEVAATTPRPGSGRLDARSETVEGEGRALHGLNHAHAAGPNDGVGTGGERTADPVTMTRPGRTIYPELAALAERDARGPEGHAEPLEPPPLGIDPHWYPNGLHWLADWQAQWHEDVARWDAWLPGYMEWYRAGLEPQWSRASRMLEATQL